MPLPENAKLISDDHVIDHPTVDRGSPRRRCLACRGSQARRPLDHGTVTVVSLP
jgi:hypothetical protein